MDDSTIGVPMTKLGYSQYSINTDGDIYSSITNKLLVAHKHRTGYWHLSLKHDEGMSVPLYVHRLVALMFIPPIDGASQVDHIDGNKDNNRMENLRWVTNRENAHYAIANDLMPHAVIKDESIAHQICDMISKGVATHRICKDLKIPYFTIHAIRMRRNWTHISDQYVFPPMRSRRVTTDKELRLIATYLQEGLSVRDIATRIGLKMTTVVALVCGKNKKRLYPYLRNEKTYTDPSGN